MLQCILTSILLTQACSFTFHSRKYKNNHIQSCTFHKCKRKSTQIKYKSNDNPQQEDESNNKILSLLFKNIFNPKSKKKNGNELKDLWSFVSSSNNLTNLSSMYQESSMLNEISLLNVESLLSFMEDNGNSSDVMNDTSTAGITSETLENVIFFNNWEFFIYILQEAMQQVGITDLLKNSPSKTTSSQSNNIQLDDVLRDTVSRFEGLIQDIYNVSSPINTVLSPLNTLTSSTIPSSEEIPILNNDSVINDEIEKNKETKSLEYTTRQVLSFVNTVLSNGYISPTSQTALFSEYNIKNISQETLQIGSKYAKLASNIYHPERWKNELLTTNYSIVGNDTISDVKYLVTDSIENGELTRIITVKGYDATDGSVDRERLLRCVITAYSETFSVGNMDYEVHSGLLSIAKNMYEEIMERYVDTLATSHKLILNGHSIGGSLSMLIMMIMVQDRGVEFVKNKVGKVYSFGAPPVIQMPLLDSVQEDNCPILTSLGLPSDLVLSFIQPWDPIPRLFTPYDPLYPLVDDIGDDGVTPYVNGPPRTLRPVVKAILEIWPSWSSFREPLKEHLYQDYIPVGSFHLLLPEPTRYLTDRLISIDISVPPLDTVLAMPMDGKKFLYFLNQFFPLTTLRVSTVPVALRSFIHHFYPAYNTTLNEFVDKKSSKGSSSNIVKDPVVSFSFPIVETDDLQSNINYLLNTTSSLSKSIPNNLDLARLLRMVLQQNNNSTNSTSSSAIIGRDNEYDSVTGNINNRIVEYDSIGKGIMPQLISNIVAIVVTSFVRYVIVPFQESSIW